MDVWFDSGVTHASVLMDRPSCKWPCDLYLEGADQYPRLVPVLAADRCGLARDRLLIRQSAPTAGLWTVEGRKMSKSLGNGIWLRGDRR